MSEWVLTKLIKRNNELQALSFVILLPLIKQQQCHSYSGQDVSHNGHKNNITSLKIRPDILKCLNILYCIIYINSYKK